MYKPNCNLYEGGVIPPCSQLLNNNNPLIKDGKLIYRNFNRLYYFINTVKSYEVNKDEDIELFATPTLVTNVQISLVTYLVGLFIHQVQINKINYDKNSIIHGDKKINDFIHKTLQNPPKVKIKCIPTLILTYSNGNAILSPITYTLPISPLNYYILLILNRLEADPGLFFINNSFATKDILNFILAEIYIAFEIKKEYIDLKNKKKA